MIDPRESVKKSLELVNQAQIDVKLLQWRYHRQYIGSEIIGMLKKFSLKIKLRNSTSQLLMAIKSINI